MLGGSCSPCCGSASACTFAGARALWESVQTKNCYLSFTTNIPKSDAAVNAGFALASVNRPVGGTLSASDAITNCVNLLTNGYNQFTTVVYYEGHDAVNADRVSLALDMSDTFWNQTSQTGRVTFVTNEYPFKCSVRFSFTPGFDQCLSAFTYISAWERIGYQRPAGSAKVAGIASSGSVDGTDQNSGEESISYAISSAQHYQVGFYPLTPGYSATNTAISQVNSPHVFWSWQNSKFAIATAWWDSATKPESVSWTESQIFNTSNSGTLSAVTVTGDTVSALGDIQFNEGRFGATAQQWQQTSASSDGTLWYSGVSLGTGPDFDPKVISMKYGYPSDGFNTYTRGYPFATLTGSSTKYVPVGPSVVSASVSVVTE